MKKIILISIVGLMFFCKASYASDWDVAGKVLTGIEGLRVISGGNIDVIGTMTGINRDKGYVKHHPGRHKGHKRYQSYCERRVWVPNYIWKMKYMPRHTEYHEKYGEIIVEAHYIKYRVERGGEWVEKCELH